MFSISDPAEDGSHLSLLSAPLCPLHRAFVWLAVCQSLKMWGDGWFPSPWNLNGWVHVDTMDDVTARVSVRDWEEAEGEARARAYLEEDQPMRQIGMGKDSGKGSGKGSGTGSKDSGKEPDKGSEDSGKGSGKGSGHGSKDSRKDSDKGKHLERWEPY